MTEMTHPTIFVDFNDHNGRYHFLTCNGTKTDLQKFGVVLKEGLVLYVSDGDLAARGTVKWSPEFSQWVIDIDPKEIVDLHKTP
jgi:hypothetical protein